MKNLFSFRKSSATSIIAIALFICIAFFGNMFMKNQTEKAASESVLFSESVYIYDNADCINDYSYAYINAYAKEFFENNNLKLFIITSPTLAENSTQSFAKMTISKNEQLKDERTVVIFLSTATGECFIFPGDAVALYLTNEKAEQLINEHMAIPTDGDYSDILRTLSMQLMSDVSANKDLIDEYGKIFVASNKDMLIGCGAVAIFFVIFAFYLIVKGKHNQKVDEIYKEQARKEYLEKMKKIDNQTKKEEDEKEGESSLIPPPPSIFPDNFSAPEPSPSETDINEKLKRTVLSSQSISSKISSDIN